jgi:uridine phosphorylase
LHGYLRPTAPIAPDVLLPSDPALALALAQRLLEKPLMANHSHGLWGYSGAGAGGHALTIQATGIGGPSAAAVLGELAAHGVCRAIRVGRCIARAPGLSAGETVIATAAIGDDGTSRALAASPVPDASLTAGLADAAGAAPAVTVAGVDLLGNDALPSWEDGAPAVADLETAAVLALGGKLGLRLAAGLVVAQAADGRRSEHDVDAALLELGAAAAAALAAQAPVRA